jgi:small GTP-binding protein
MSEALPDLKVVFLGNSAVGKTTIISAFMQNWPEDDPAPTVGACVTSGRVTIEKGEVRLKIWDTAGQERFRALAPMYYRGADVAVLVYAVNDRDSFEGLSNWLDDLGRDSKPMPALIIAGNKIDLERMIGVETGESFAEQEHAAYVECCGKNGDGISNLFTTAAILGISAREKKGDGDPVAKEVTDGQYEDRKKRKCC